MRRVVVIEANFRPYSAYERERLAALGGRPVEVHCACPPGVAAARYNARVTHPVHVITTLPVAAMAEYDRPVGIGDLVTVDTTRPVDVAGVAPRGAGRGARGGGYECGARYGRSLVLSRHGYPYPVSCRRVSMIANDSLVVAIKTLRQEKPLRDDCGTVGGIYVLNQEIS